MPNENFRKFLQNRKNTPPSNTPPPAEKPPVRIPFQGKKEPPKPQQKQPKKKGPPQVPTNAEGIPLKITHLCGHKIGLEQYMLKACPACHKKKKQEARAKKRAKKGLPPNQPYNKEKHFKRKNLGRLPHGSRFSNLVYDAERMMWSGSLIIPTPEGKQVFEGELSAVFRLLAHLDKQYRATLPQPPTPPVNVSQGR